jgi:hypothetical protein
MLKQSVMAAALILGSVSALPAAAQNRSLNQQGGLVNVSVQNVDILNNFLNDNEIDILRNANFPITVQAPINIAANVCNVAVNVLARGGPARNEGCTAQQGSAALAQLVRRQHLNR